MTKLWARWQIHLCGKVTSAVIKGEEFLDQLNDCQVFKKHSTELPLVVIRQCPWTEVRVCTSHFNEKEFYSPFGIPQGPLVLELSRKSRSYFLAGGYVRATWPTVTSHDARNTKNSVRKLYAISWTRHCVINTSDWCCFTLGLKQKQEIVKIRRRSSPPDCEVI